MREKLQEYILKLDSKICDYRSYERTTKNVLKWYKLEKDKKHIRQCNRDLIEYNQTIIDLILVKHDLLEILEDLK